MRIGIVSSYPPRHCGIGSYASAQAERLRSEGHEVTVITPHDGAGDVRVGFMGGGGFREAERLGATWDRLIVHFEPGLHNRSGPTAMISKVRSSLALLSLVRRWPTVEIVVHEAHRARWWRPDHVILRRAFARGQLLFHTDAERERLERDYGIRVRARLIEHRDGVRVRGPGTREEARRSLGLDPDPPLFLCAGFLHPWKGFDRAINAFAGSDGPGELMIVGSVRDARRTHVAYAADLRTLAETTDGVTLIESFQSDEDFDAWITAADHLVLPYTRAWSSGALARARLLGTPAIVSAVGGLPEQACPDDEVVHSDEELTEVFGRLRRNASADRGEVEARP
jgi:glycosyltransferase involved in cell wall biosynthesis